MSAPRFTIEVFAESGHRMTVRGLASLAGASALAQDVVAHPEILRVAVCDRDRVVWSATKGVAV